MSIKDQLQADLKTALLNKDDLRKNAIRFTSAAIKNAEIAKNKPLSDEEVLAVLSSEVKRRRDTIAELETANRPDLLKQEQAELDVVLSYLPKQMSREEVTTAAQAVIAEVGAKSSQDMGKVMGKLMPQLKGKADGKMISEVVKELLAG